MHTERSTLPSYVSPGTSQKHALLYFTHVFNERHFKKFKALQQAFFRHGDTFTLYFSESGELTAPSALHAYGTDRLSLCTLNYPWMHNKLMPGHTNYPLMHFARHHPGYKSYTVVEYDVELTGSWEVFFDHCMRDDADFLATHIADQDEQPAWYFWNTVCLPAERQGGTSPIRRLRFFGPLYKISNRALKAVDHAYGEGATGHFEALIPTVLSEQGLSVRDLNELKHPVFGGHERWYTKPSHDPAGKLTQSSMRFRPNRLFPGWRPDTLYHPVKFGKGERVDYLRRKLDKLLQRSTP